jgi:hypothetical protein
VQQSAIPAEEKLRMPQRPRRVLPALVDAYDGVDLGVLARG